MADSAPSRTRSRLLRTAAAVAALAAAAGALRLAGAFTDDGSVDAPPAEPAPAAKPAVDTSDPSVETIGVGESPVAVAAVGDRAWVADGLDDVASLVEIPHELPLRTSYSLSGPSTAVAAGEGGVWFALQREALERLSLSDPSGDPTTIDLEDHPSAVEVGAGSVWALGNNGVDRIDPRTGEVTDRFSTAGFANALAVTDEGVWIIADDREVTRRNPESGEVEAGPVEVADAASLAVDGEDLWVVSSSGRVTRLDSGSLAQVGEPVDVPAAVDVAVGSDGVWVAAADGTVTRLNPQSGAVVGDPIEVGDEPRSISAAGDFVWVANSGDGTVSRITP